MESEDKLNKKAFDYAIRLLAMRDYSVFKMTNKLKSREFTIEDINAVIAKLVEYKYLQEDVYTKVRIKQFLYKGFSNRSIKIKLSEEMLKTSDELINQIRDEQENSEEDQIQKLIHKKLRGKTIPSEFEAKMKLKNKVMYFLCSKGHSPSKVSQILSEYNL